MLPEFLLAKIYSMLHWLVLFHVFGATIWVGGHLILSLAILPKALKENNPDLILQFEKNYEKIGLPALFFQVITGIWLSLLYIPFSDWFTLATSHNRFLWIKLGLLLATITLAIHARFFILHKLSKHNLQTLAFHILLVTLLAVSFVITGLSFRYAYF